MSDFSTGVTTLLARMESNPEEFFGEAPRWKFIFREHFRDVMTEAEKGAIHQGMKEVRRLEFDAMVVKEIMRDERAEMEALMANPMGITESMRISSNGSLGVGSSSGYFASANTNTASPSLKIGKQILSEEDIARIKASTYSLGVFK